MNIIDVGLQFNSNMSRMGNINGIVLHHTAVSSLQSVEVIHNYHKNHNGWAGIGYHYYVRKDGSVYKGRPEEYAGAHCPGVNSTSIGICAEGNFNEETMSDVQKNAIIELIAYVKSRHNITYIKGHREIIATSCPGSNYPLDEIRNANVVYASSPISQPISNTYTYKDFVGDVQSAIGARVDKIAGPETLSKTPTISRYKNNRHAVIRPVQKYLYSLGHTEVGDADGMAGSKFEQAVKHYQRDNGCVQDGEITAHNKTWKKLLRLA